jgi:hypothetical protein
VKTGLCTTHGQSSSRCTTFRHGCVTKESILCCLFLSKVRSKQAGTDIDVFLEPLIEDMTKLWNEGVRMWDQYQQEYFTLYAIIFVCIYDAPGGFTLSGKTKGKSGACSICVDKTASVYLPSSRKLVYMRHR